MSEHVMNGDELGALIYAEFGYLVVQIAIPVTMGFILEPSGDDENQTKTVRLRIIAESNEEEWRAQNKRCSEITGLPLGPARFQCPHFYRAEACD